MWSILPCRHLLTGRSWGRYKHSRASSGGNLWLVSYSMMPSNWCKCDEASPSVEEEQAASPTHLLCTIYWGCCPLSWPDLWLISTTLGSSKRICIWDIAQQQGGMLGSHVCNSRYLMAAPGISGHLCTASGDIHRHTHTIFELPGLVIEVRVKVLSIAKYSAAAANSLFTVPTLAKIHLKQVWEHVYTAVVPPCCLPVCSIVCFFFWCEETH